MSADAGSFWLQSLVVALLPSVEIRYQTAHCGDFILSLRLGLEIVLKNIPRNRYGMHNLRSFLPGKYADFSPFIMRK